MEFDHDNLRLIWSSKGLPGPAILIGMPIYVFTWFP